MSSLPFFRTLLNALWLRPESALWYAHMLDAAHEFGAHALPSPNLDFGCMDGLNSYVLLGGQLPFSFDVFDSLPADRDMYRRTTLGDDYYDAPLKSDPISFPPVSHQFDLGVDWKQSHIDRSKRMGAHKKLLLVDRDHPLKDLAADSLRGIWAPNLYWMSDISSVLSEFRRVTAYGGKIVTILPDAELMNSLIYTHRQAFDEEWLSSLDRGRYENAERSARSLDQWLAILELNGLRVLRHSMFLPVTINLIYEIGFRPMFAPLLALRQSLISADLDSLLVVKREWVSRIADLGDMFLGEDPAVPGNTQRLWHVFELTPLR